MRHPFLHIVIGLLLIASARAQSWTHTTSGSWNTASNWSSGTVPNGIGANVTLGSVIAAASATIAMNNNTETLGTLTISNTGAGVYTIGSSQNDGTLDFKVSSGSSTITTSASNAVINSSVKLNNATTFNTTSGTLKIDGQISTGTNTYTKTGAGTLVISGSLSNNTGGGTGAKVIVNQGTLALAVTNGGQAVANGTAISVNSGGTLLMEANTEVYLNNLTLNGGTLNNNGTEQNNFGTLTLTANSTINMGAAGSSLIFGDVGTGSGITWTSGAVLTILGWVSGDTIQFGGGNSGSDALTAQQVSQIKFDINGSLVGALFNGTDVVPTPESPVILCAVLLVGLIVAVEVRSRLKRAAQARNDSLTPA